MADTHIYENAPDHHFRTEIPNIVTELELSIEALGLYTYLKRVAGDGGSCWKCKKTILKEIGVGDNRYLKYRKELSKPFAKLGGKSLIKVISRKKDDGSPDTTKIEIVEIWRENGDYNRNKNKITSPQNDRGSPQNDGGVTSKSRLEEEPSKEYGGGVGDNFSSHENYNYITPIGKELSVTVSEIFRYFIKIPEIPTEVIERAINQAKKENTYVSDPFRYIEGICRRLTQVKKEKETKPKKPKKQHHEPPVCTAKGVRFPIEELEAHYEKKRK